METITEDYVSFETAKLLKEKGFNGDTASCYILEDSTHHIMSDKVVQNEYYESQDSNEHGHLIQAPTLQMVMKWLREVHGLFISIGNDDLDYNWQIFDIKNRTKDLDPTCLTDSYGGYRKYELACTLAIKYCLENLI